MTDNSKFQPPFMGLGSDEDTNKTISIVSASHDRRLLRGVNSWDCENADGPAKSKYTAVVSLDMLMVVRVAILLETWFFI